MTDAGAKGVAGQQAGGRGASPLALGRVVTYPGLMAGMVMPALGMTFQIHARIAAAHGAGVRLRRVVVSCLPDLAVQSATRVVAAGVGDFPLVLAQAVVDVAICLQARAGLPVEGGVVRAKDGGEIELLVPYFDPVLAEAAARRACLLLGQVVRALAAQGDRSVQQLVDAHLARWSIAVRGKGLLPNTLRFIRSAQAKRIPWLAVTPEIIQFGHGARSRRLQGSFTNATSSLATQIARKKHLASRWLAQGGIPVPRQGQARTEDESEAIAKVLGYPVVVKPSGQDQGVGVVTNLRDGAAVRRAFVAARKHGLPVLVEKHIDGADHRLLVVGGRLMAAARRIPGGVVGDGSNTVEALVGLVNGDPARGTDKRGLIRLALDAEAAEVLAEQGLGSKDVLPAGAFVRLRHTANISTGGVPVDVTAGVHPDNRILVERAARLVGLDVAGVDLLISDISKSWREVGGAICEVNAQPGLRPHWISQPERDINGEILEWLLAGEDGRIPIVAVTGTNGKTTVCQMVHGILRSAGRLSGVATTQGVWIGEDQVSTDNLSGFPGGHLLLTDPAVEAAVIEVPRKGLLRFGFPFDRCHVAALLNVQDDHVGRDGIDSLEAMAALKGEVLGRATDALVINADDPLCMAQRPEDGRRLILVSALPSNPAVKVHRSVGGTVVLLAGEGQDRCIEAFQGADPIFSIRARDIPATQGGIVLVNAWNGAFAVAIGLGLGVLPAHIKMGLEGFTSSLERNPGRFNWIDDYPFRVLLDYAHNPDGVRELCRALPGLELPGRRILVCLKVGNRHSSHIQPVADLVAGHFDAFVCGCGLQFVQGNPEYGGKPPDWVPRLLAEALRRAGVEADRIHYAATPNGVGSALRDIVRPGDSVVILADLVDAREILLAARPEG